MLKKGVKRIFENGIHYNCHNVYLSKLIKLLLFYLTKNNVFLSFYYWRRMNEKDKNYCYGRSCYSFLGLKQYS